MTLHGVLYGCISAGLGIETQDPVAYFFYWLGLSIGIHAFPSKDDLSNIWDLAPEKAKHGNVRDVISLPLIAILYVLNCARIVWAELGYGIAVGILGPIALFRALA